MQRSELLAWLACEILRRKQPERPLKVAVDGRCGAGKTVLTDELAVILRRVHPGMTVLCPSVDGFHHRSEHRYRQGKNSSRGYYEDAFDYSAIVRYLLSPLAGCNFPVRCFLASHDLRTDRRVDAPPTEVGTNSILLFEGLFLFRQELNPFWDVRVHLQVDAETSIERAVSRDSAGSMDSGIRRKYEQRYEPAWQIYEQAVEPSKIAQILIEQSDFAVPRVLRS